MQGVAVPRACRGSPALRPLDCSDFRLQIWQMNFRCSQRPSLWLFKFKDRVRSGVALVAPSVSELRLSPMRAGSEPAAPTPLASSLGTPTRP